MTLSRIVTATLLFRAITRLPFLIGAGSEAALKLTLFRLVFRVFWLFDALTNRSSPTCGIVILFA
jgi:hypothetical protein